MTQSHQSIIRVGTRQSPLALVQTESVIELLIKEDSKGRYETIGIQTKGDQDKRSALQDIGGKGVFVKSLETALLQNDVDIAVHSAKDMTSAMHPDLCIAAVCNTTARCDSFVFTNGATCMSDLPQNAMIATGSLRRRALVASLYPEFSCVPIRGNVETRLQLANEKGLDAVLLSEVGLHRLNLNPNRFCCDPKLFIPAPSQGVIAIQTRKNETELIKRLIALSDAQQLEQFQIERHVMEKIGFDCHVPFGLYLELAEKSYHIEGFMADHAVSKWQRFSWEIPQDDWQAHIHLVTDDLRTWQKNHD